MSDVAPGHSGPPLFTKCYRSKCLDILSVVSPSAGRLLFSLCLMVDVFNDVSYRSCWYPMHRSSLYRHLNELVHAGALTYQVAPFHRIDIHLSPDVCSFLSHPLSF